MGSIIGGLYAAGYSADSLESIVKSIDWNFLLSDKVRRENLSMHDKIDDDRFILTIPIRNKKFSLPEGMIRGQHIENIFSRLCAPVHHIKDFSQLPIPFFCIAVDINTGREIVLRSGNLAEAMRASMAIPSAFEPMAIEDYKLLDGGLVNNFPAQYVRDMGADILIGVDVGHGSQNQERDDNFLSIMIPAELN